MRTQSIFLDTPLQFAGAEKYAGLLTPLGDNADRWPQVILEEAYRQCPYLSDFQVHANLDRVDEERGYGVGSLEVQSPTQQTPAEMDTSETVNSCQIPFVIREKKLAPLDLLLENGKYTHLTEGRLRAAMFRGDTFDAVRERPADPSLYQDLQPPGDGGMKLAMVTPLLPQLSGRVHALHLERMKIAMSEPSVQAAYLNAHEGVKAAFDSALRLEATDRAKTAQAAWERIKPNVVQLQKLANGNYLLKHANSEMYYPQQEEVPPAVAEEMLSDLDLTAQMEADGTITASPDATAKQTLDTEEVRVVDQPGVWKVQDKMGNTLTGWCFPQLLSLDMQPMPLTLFSNGSEFALQEHVAGMLITKGTELPKGRMQGYGALYYLDHGTPRVFVPMTVQNSYRGPDGQIHFIVQTDLGEQLDLTFHDALRTVVRLSETEYGLPEAFAKWWMPLKSKTELVDEPMSFTKYASARPVSSKGEIISDGQLYSFRGPPFAKVASSRVTFLQRPDAEFVGVAAGIDPGHIKEALDSAAKKNLVKVSGLRTLWDPAEKIARTKAKVAALVKEIGLRNYSLVKEASILDDALTADKVLGLGFLNAENVSTFVDLIPGLEYALSKVAEMLMASRIGLKDIPEVALERMMVALEDVLQGLKTLKQREVSYVEN